MLIRHTGVDTIMLLDIASGGVYNEMQELMEPVMYLVAMTVPILIGAAYVGARSLLRTYLQRGSNGPRNRHPGTR